MNISEFVIYRNKVAYPTVIDFLTIAEVFIQVVTESETKKALRRGLSVLSNFDYYVICQGMAHTRQYIALVHFSF